MPPSITPTTTVVSFHRMDEDSYRQLTKGMPAIAVDNNTTERQMGFQLGIQYVLQKLREGYVVAKQ